MTGVIKPPNPNSNAKVSNLNWEKAGFNAVVAGTVAGVLGGTVLAPPKIKSLGELYDKEDVFTSSMAKIDDKAPSAAQVVKCHLESLKEMVLNRQKTFEQIFLNDKITIDGYKQYLNMQQTIFANHEKTLNAYYGDLLALKGQKVSQEIIDKIGQKHDVTLPESFSKLKDSVKETEVLVDDNIIKAWKENLKNSMDERSIAQKILQNGLTLEKDGTISKKELLAFFKESFKESDKANFLVNEKHTYNSIRKYLPKAHLKGALTSGGVAVLVGGILGLFASKKD